MEAALAEERWYADQDGDTDDDAGPKEIPLREEKEEPPQLAEMRRIQTQVMGAISSHRQLWEAEHPGQIFDAVRPLSRGRSQLSQEERRRLQLEQVEAKFKGKRWQERGPLDTDTPFWRGQARRSGAYGGQQRFANRGGKRKEYFAEKWQRSEGHIDG